jgi:hypothetical protein
VSGKIATATWVFRLAAILGKSRVAPSSFDDHIFHGNILVEAKVKNLATMGIDQLWALYEEIGAILSTKIEAEKRELERRLARLKGMGNAVAATAHAAEVLKREPKFSVAVYLATQHYKRDVDRKRHEAGLLLSGLPV